MNGSPWCEAEKQILKLTAPNLNAAEIGALIGRTLAWSVAAGQKLEHQSRSTARG